MDEMTPEDMRRLGVVPEWVKKEVREAAESMGKDNPLNQYLTTQEVVQRLCLHPDTVRRYCREGKIRAFRLGTKWRIRPMDYVDFLEAKMPRPDERIMRMLRERQEA